MSIKLPNDWNVLELKELIDKKRSIRYGIVQPGEYDQNGRYMVRGQDYSFGWVEPENLFKVSDAIESKYKNARLKTGDIILTIVGAGTGTVAIVPDWLDGANCTQTTARIAIEPSKADSLYCYYYLSSDKGKKLTYQNIKGGAQPGLNCGDIEYFEIILPPLPEQKAVARVLSTWDAAIHTTQKLIAQKELRKKWLMQQLLTGKKRLNGFENTKWKIQPLENFIKPIVREVPKPSTPYLGIGLRSHGKGTFLKHDEQPEKNSMDNFYVVRPNDLIVNITFAWEQAIAIVRPEDDGALASHRFPTYTFIEDKGHPDFFRFYILQPRMKFMLQMISPGGAGRNRVMSKSDFIKLEFLLPDYKEQTAIAQVLQAADKEISLLKAKAEKLREQKKGLMQVLLTGKVRLKIN